MLHILSSILIIQATFYESVRAKLYDVSNLGIHDLEDINFDNFTTNKEVVFLVEFYASWCGHCQAFAPKIKALGEDIHSWDQVVKIITIDCGHDSCCTQTCSHFGARSYPTMKYFPPHFEKHQGREEAVTIPSSVNVSSLRNGLVDYLTNLKENIPKHWPQLTFIDESSYMSLRNNNKTKDVLIIVESETSYLGREVILDLSHFTHVFQIVRAKPDSKWLDNVPNLPSNIPYVLKLHGREQWPSIYWNETDPYEDHRKLLTNLISSDFSLDISAKFPEITSTPKQSAKSPVPQASDDLYIDDLYRSLKYTLYSEIPRSQSLNLTKLDILRRLLHVIVEYFPFLSKEDKEVASNFSKYLSTVGWEMSSDTYINSLAQLDENNSWSRYDDYRTCKGSTPTYRGYSCSLWLFFHTLTVGEYLAQHKDPMKKSQHHVLLTMRDYIPKFFGCQECAKHFSKMSQDVDKSLIHPNSSVLWLWKAHNEVNQRLAGAASEDPGHKKELYPPKSLCSSCWNSDQTFNEHKVFEFLVQKYKKSNILGFLEPTDSSNRPVSGPFRREWQWPYIFFSSLDISLCLVLYILTSFMLLAFCFILGIKKRPKRDFRSRHMLSA